MITTADALTWLRRSDQAITWARAMLSPHRAVVIDCETTDLPGAIGGKVGYSNLRNRTRIWLPLLPKPLAGKIFQSTHVANSEKMRSRLMHESSIGCKLHATEGNRAHPLQSCF